LGGQPSAYLDTRLRGTLLCLDPLPISRLAISEGSPTRS
jgi:hypothetical protein